MWVTLNAKVLRVVGTAQSHDVRTRRPTHL